MTDVRDASRPAWQVELVSDKLQPAIDTYVILRRTADAISRYVEQELNRRGVTTAQYGILLHLSRGKSLSLTDLSGLVFRSNSALTSLIDRMERDGLVARAVHANDRRVRTVELTQAGRDLLLQIRAHHRPFLAGMMSCLSSDELGQLRELLRKIEQQVDEASRSPAAV